MTFWVIRRYTLDRLTPSISAASPYPGTGDRLICGLAQGTVASLAVVVNSGKGAKEFIGRAVLFDNDDDVINRALALPVGRTGQKQNKCEQSFNRGLDRAVSKTQKNDVCVSCLKLRLHLRQCRKDQLPDLRRER